MLEGSAEARPGRDTGTRRHRGQGALRRDLADGGNASGHKILRPLPPRAGHQLSRFPAGRRGWARKVREARILPACQHRIRVLEPPRHAAKIRPGNWPIVRRVFETCPDPECLASRTQRRGVVPRVLRARCAVPRRGKGRNTRVEDGPDRAGRSTRHPVHGRQGRALLPLDPSADSFLRRFLRLGPVGAPGTSARRPVRLALRRMAPACSHATGAFSASLRPRATEGA